MANYQVWAGTRTTPFEKFEDAIEYAKRINKRNKYTAKILRKTGEDDRSSTWQEVHY